MKALTLWQPWAHAITHYGKRIENRTWKPPAALVGRDFAIHAGGRVDGESTRDLIEEGIFPEDFNPNSLWRFHVVAVARLARVVHRALDVPSDQFEWWAGPVGWLFDDLRVLVEPVRCRGKQGLWELPLDVHRLVLDAAKRPADA